MKELHERVAELELRVGRLEGIVGDPEKTAQPERVFPPASAASTGTIDTPQWPEDEPEPAEKVDVVSGGTVLSPA